MKQKFCNFPLEIKLIIYEYFDPKNIKFICTRTMSGYEYFIDYNLQQKTIFQIYNIKNYYFTFNHPYTFLKCYPCIYEIVCRKSIIERIYKVVEKFGIKL